MVFQPSTILQIDAISVGARAEVVNGCDCANGLTLDSHRAFGPQVRDMVPGVAPGRLPDLSKDCNCTLPFALRLCQQRL